MQTDRHKAAPHAADTALRVVFLGMDLNILAALRILPVCIVAAYLPPAPYEYLARPPFWWRLLPRFVIKKRIRTATLHHPLARFLDRSGIPPIQAPRVNGDAFRRRLTEIAPDLGIVANFNQILGRPLLGIPRYGFINFHPSLLPKFRGPHPLGHILLNKEKISGATWHKVTEKVDQGDILAQTEFDVDPQETLKTLEKKAAVAAVDMLGPLLQRIAQGDVEPQRQNKALASYFPKLTPMEKARLAQLEQDRR